MNEPKYQVRLTEGEICMAISALRSRLDEVEALPKPEPGSVASKNLSRTHSANEAMLNALMRIGIKTEDFSSHNA